MTTPKQLWVLGLFTFFTVEWLKGPTIWSDRVPGSCRVNGLFENNLWRRGRFQIIVFIKTNITHLHVNFFFLVVAPSMFCFFLTPASPGNPVFNVAMLWTLGNALMQNLQRCRLTESLHKGLKKSARETSCTWRFDWGTALNPHGLIGNSVQTGIQPVYLLFVSFFTLRDCGAKWAARLHFLPTVYQGKCWLGQWAVSFCSKKKTPITFRSVERHSHVENKIMYINIFNLYRKTSLSSFLLSHIWPAGRQHACPSVGLVQSTGGGCCCKQLCG